jgi:nucleotide-binding universal stress UspA family protein
MKTILVATDFSATALNAAQYAADMAKAITADVLLFHVYQMPVIYGEVPVAINTEDMLKNAEKEMIKLKGALVSATMGKLNIETEISEGVFFTELESICERINPYAVIMGSQGTTAAERLLFGGHTTYAVEHLRWPLITVPPQAKFNTIKKLGLACDFEKVTETVPIDEIKMLVNVFNAELHLLHTGKEKVFNTDIPFASGMFDEMFKDIKPKYHFITAKNTDEGIMDFAEKLFIDLLIVLPKKHGLLYKLMHRSHAKKMVLHSHVPVMVLH